MFETSNTSIPKSELEHLREHEFILNELQKSAKIGWWKVNFNTHKIICSDYIVDILDLKSNIMTVDELLDIINAGHRQRVSNTFIHIRTQNFYDEVFPIRTKYGELWIHSKLGNKIIQADNTITAIGYSQILDEETSATLYKQNKGSRLKELLIRQFSLSQSLSNFLKTTDTRKAITDTLQELLHQFNGDRTYIFEYDKKKGTQSCIYEATREGVTPEIDTLQGIDINSNQWWSKQILNNIPIILNNLDEMPPDSENDKQVLARQNIASLMVFPLISAKGIWGYMGIDIVDKPRLWSTIDREWFSAISNIINICIELRSSEKKAQIEREYFKSLYDHMPIGYLRLQLLYDETGKANNYKYLDANPAFYNIIGSAPGTYIGLTAKDIGMDKPEEIGVLQRVVSSGRTHEGNRTLPVTGRQYHVIIYPQSQDEIVALFTDITEQMKTMEALRRSEETLRNIYKNIPVGIEIYDSAGILLDLNDIESEIFGFERKEDVLGVNLFDNPNLPVQHLEALQQGKEIMFPLTYKFSSVNKTYYNTKHEGTRNLTVKGTCLYDLNHNITNYLLIVIDNTAALKAYRKIEEFETLFNDIAEFSKVGICRWNPLRDSFFGSDVWFQNLNQTPRPIHNITEAYEHVHPEDLPRLTRFFKDVIDGEEQKFSDQIRIRFGDSWRWMRVRFKVKEYNPRNGVIELIGLNIDITELKETEKELITAKQKAEESDRLKSAFLANMSHEIRTPLNAIVGFSNLLTETDDLADRELYISVIQKNNELLLQLISDILDLSKIEAGTFDVNYAEVDVNALCEEIIRAHAMKLSENVILTFEDHLPRCFISSDRNRINQVLSNFINNAIKFTDHGHIRVGYQTTGEHLKFYVQDSGIGISPENQKQIFDRFVKLDSFARGTGLGLPICKSIINKLGGSIGVESTLGVGSRFWFTLPYNQQPQINEPDTIKSRQLPRTPDNARKKILVAEDTDSNFVLVSTILRDNYDIIRARTGEEATRLHGEHRPDLILMDIRMPDLDGLAATRRIRETDPDVKIIALSAFAYDSDKQKAFDAGCNDYMVKPISPSQLKRIIQIYL